MSTGDVSSIVSRAGMNSASSLSDPSTSDSIRNADEFINARVTDNESIHGEYLIPGERVNLELKEGNLDQRVHKLEAVEHILSVNEIKRMSKSARRELTTSTIQSDSMNIRLMERIITASSKTEKNRMISQLARLIVNKQKLIDLRARLISKRELDKVGFDIEEQDKLKTDQLLSELGYESDEIMTEDRLSAATSCVLLVNYEVIFKQVVRGASKSKRNKALKILLNTEVLDYMSIQALVESGLSHSSHVSILNQIIQSHIVRGKADNNPMSTNEIELFSLVFSKFKEKKIKIKLLQSLAHLGFWVLKLHLIDTDVRLQSQLQHFSSNVRKIISNCPPAIIKSALTLEKKSSRDEMLNWVILNRALSDELRIKVANEMFALGVSAKRSSLIL